MNKVKIQDLPINSEFKYHPDDKGIFKVIEVESDVWIKTKRMCGRNSGDFPWKEVYPINIKKQ